MNTTSIGKEAETAAARWLTSNGFKIMAQNWRTRWCEIDVIAQKGAIVYFVEVRYRKSSSWGDGLESVTAKKQQQMNFAATFWLHQNDWSGDARICVIAAQGDPVTVNSFVEV